MCGTTRWKAAKAASKSMSSLDETGVSMAGCRHVIGQKALNMFRGEMYALTHAITTLPMSLGSNRYSS